MFNIQIGGEFYAVDFRHKTTQGSRAQLSRRSPVKAITTCVVTAQNFVAIDNAICVLGDQFSRWAGRTNAFNHLIRNCKALKPEVRDALQYRFSELNPPPISQSQRVIVPISDDERQRRISAGRHIAAERQRQGHVRQERGRSSEKARGEAQ